MDPEAVREPTYVPVGVPIEQVVPGRERVTDHGSHYLIEAVVDDPTRPGFRDVCSEALIRVLGTSSLGDRIPHSDVLFLDTETTGLDRGTGTHVFLVGVGYFDSEAFVVRQYFIRDLHEEASMLHDLAELLDHFPVMSTFNGRAFDWPLLYNRFILHGYREVPELAHWDLLPPSRRVWKRRLRDCSLGNLERNVLGIQRYGDVPGFLIPQLYFDYLRDRDARPLLPVFSHNQEDIVSLARLADRLLATELDPVTSLEDPVDRLCYGLHLLSHGDPRTGVELVNENLDSPMIDSDLRGRAFRALASHFKREGKLDEAVALWMKMDGYSWTSPDTAIYPLIELAKVYEHKFRDFHAAIHWVERAINLTAIRGWYEYRPELAHRYARLQRRNASSARVSSLEVE
jgi:uncharacterized protein